MRFLFEMCILGNCQNFDSNARRLTKLEPNEIFNDFAISREPFDEIDSNFFYFKDMDSKIPPDQNESSSSHILMFKLNYQFNIS